MTFASSLSRIMVRPPILVRRNRPWLSQAWIVHLLIPPNRRAASSTENNSSIEILRSNICVQVDCRLTMHIWRPTFIYMALHTSQVSGSKRAFAGELRASGLTYWLNNVQDEAAKARVVEFHRLLFELVKTANNPEKNPDPHSPKSPWEKLRRRVNRALLKYPVCSQVIWFRIGYFMTGYVPAVERTHRVGSLLTESGAIFELLDVFRQPGNWWRIRQCYCGTYYFRRFRHQRFCSEACRVREFRSSEEWKAHRRKKAREYYWLHKNKNVK